MMTKEAVLGRAMSWERARTERRWAIALRMDLGAELSTDVGVYRELRERCRGDEFLLEWIDRKEQMGRAQMAAIQDLVALHESKGAT